MTVTEEGYKGLPVYRGLPVPWVARWSGEVTNIPYRPEVVTDDDWQWPRLVMQGQSRDKHGVLWNPENPGHVGVPDFGTVSTYRQKSSMRHRRCQICGEHIRTPWTLYMLPQIEKLMLDQHRGNPFTSPTPPICSDCAEFSPTICPELTARGATLVKVTEQREWGVFGEVAKIRPEGKSFGVARAHAEAEYGTAKLRATLGKQLLMLLEEYEVIQTWDPK